MSGGSRRRGRAHPPSLLRLWRSRRRDATPWHSFPLTVRKSSSSRIDRANRKSGWPILRGPTQSSSHHWAPLQAIRAGLPMAGPSCSIPTRSNIPTGLSSWCLRKAARCDKSRPIRRRTSSRASLLTDAGFISPRRAPRRHPSGRSLCRAARQCRSLQSARSWR